MENFGFRYWENIIFFLSPVMVLCIIILGNKKKEKILRKINIKSEIRFRRTRGAMLFLGMAFTAFSLMGPQIFKGVSEVEGKGLDIYVLLDTSKSMLCEDVKPSRMNRALKTVEGMLDNLDGDRIGFIPFSSSAYIQMPLTDDYSMAKMFLNVVDTELISGGGSNIGNALKLAEKSFDETTAGNKVVIVVGDGEEPNSKSVEALKNIKDDRLKVYTVGVGTEKGGLIPEYDPRSGEKNGYKKDKNGETVVSKLNEDILKRLATEGGGKYYRSTPKGDEIEQLNRDIAALQKDTFKSRKIKNYTEIYQYFLMAGIVMILAAYALPERRREV